MKHISSLPFVAKSVGGDGDGKTRKDWRSAAFSVDKIGGLIADHSLNWLSNLKKYGSKRFFRSV
jgi:hypothetical protein